MHVTIPPSAFRLTAPPLLRSPVSGSWSAGIAAHAVATVAAAGPPLLGQTSSFIRRLSLGPRSSLGPALAPLKRLSPPRPSPMNLNFFRNLFTYPTPEQVNMASQKVQKLIDDNAVMVFSKSYCPYCKATKNLLNSVGAKFQFIELDEDAEGNALQDALQEISGQSTFPNIYIKQKHIGGNSDLQSLSSSGELKTLLTDAGAL